MSRMQMSRSESVRWLFVSDNPTLSLARTLSQRRLGIKVTQLSPNVFNLKITMSRVDVCIVIVYFEATNYFFTRVFCRSTTRI